VEHTLPRGVLDRPPALRLFASQFGVATVRQLVELGISERAIGRAKQRGVLAVVLPGVIELADFPPTFRQRAMAAQLFGGVDSFLDGPTAGRCYGLRGMPKRPIDLVIGARRRGALPDWLRTTCSTWIDRTEVVEREDGLRIATPPRMLLGLASRLNDVQFERAAEDAWHLQLVSPVQAAEYLQRVAAHGRLGVDRMRRWLDTVADRSRPAQSGLEIKVATAGITAGVPAPVRQHPLILANGALIHLDLAWPDVMLAFEPGHSWWHGGDLGQRADQQRRRECAAVGWQVECYDESAVTNLAAVGSEIAAIYHERRRRFRTA
jgi:hypothetical protein